MTDVVVEVSGPWWSGIEPGLAADRIAAALADSARVRVQPAGNGAEPAVQVWLDGRPCPYPPELIWDAVGYARNMVAPWLGATGATAAALADLDPAQASEVLELLVPVVVAAHREPPAGDVDAPPLGVVVSDSVARVLTDEPDPAGLFHWLREGLFEELGLLLPPLHLRVDPALRADSFAFVVAGVRGIPRLGPPAGAIFVNARPGSVMAHGARPEEVVNPATSQPAALVPSPAREWLEAEGYTAWTAAEFLLLALAATVRPRAGEFLPTSRVTELVERTAEVSPLLVAACRAAVADDVVAGVLRDLLDDGISVRNLRRILELVLLHHDLDGDPATRTAFVRTGLAGAVTARLARGTATVVVYLLGSGVDDAVGQYELMRGTAAGDVLQRTVLAALQDELRTLPATAQVPAVLIRDDLREPLRAMLRHTLPLVRVAGYSDVLPHVNVQPVARIELDTARV